MIDFLLAVLLICGILAIPPLRKIAIWLIGGVVVIFVTIMLLTPGYHPVPQSLTTSESQAAALRRQAKEAATQADEISKHLIAPGEIEVRQLWLTTFGRPVELILPGLDDVAIAAIVQNRSAQYTLTEMDVTADLFDCPAAIAVVGPQCDQIGQFEDHLHATIPPGQVREMTGPGLGSIRNLPPLSGHLVLRHSIFWARAAAPGQADTHPIDTNLPAP